MRRLIERLTLVALWAALLGAQQFPAPRLPGTLTRMESGEEYLGTYSAGTATGGLSRAVSIPVYRGDQVYVITGRGMEYVVTERSSVPAHVVINSVIWYTIQGDQFAFFDQENRRHPARIARQTLIDPSALVELQPTTWKDVNGGARFFVRRTPTSIYAEEILGRAQGGVPTRMDATSENGRYIGRRYWAEGKCSFDEVVEFVSAGDGRIRVEFKGPAPDAKLDKRHCRYSKKMQVYASVWIPE